MLILESGSGINVGANTYVTDGYFIEFMSNRIQIEGEIVDPEMPELAKSREVLLIKAMDYLEGLSTLYIGRKRTQSQPLLWPRISVVIDGFNVNRDVIPKELKYAQCFLAYASINIDILKNFDSSYGDIYVTKEEVYQAVNVEYRRSDQADTSAILRKVNVYLNKLLMNANVSVRS